MSRSPSAPPRSNPRTGTADYSLHSKAMVFGPDLFIGSANADVRSYMLDTNNGLVIRGAPRLPSAYTAWVDAVVADPTMVEDRTVWFTDAARAETRAEDQAFVARRLRELTAGTELDERMPVEHPAARLSGVFDRAYELGAGILGGGLLQLGAPRRFDRLFKVL